MPKLPFLISRLFFIVAALLVIKLVFPGVLWFGVVIDVVSTLFIPIDSSTVGVAVFLVILGAALARRKRMGLVVALIFLAGILLNSLLYVGILLVLISADEPLQVGDQLLLARFSLNLATLGCIFVTLLVHRAEFSARRPPGGVRKALLVLIGGLALTTVVGMLLVTLSPGPLAQPRSRLVWLFRRMLGLVPGTELPPGGPPTWISSTIGALVAVTLLAALVALMRSQRAAALMSPEDEPLVRALVAQSSADSLAYFATRRDKSVVFAPDGRAAITYRLELGVCLASSDPIGEPDHWPSAIAAWHQLVNTYGWTPAVIGASEAGATAYARSGLRVIRLGDEAVLSAKDFQLEGREMRPVRQAVQRLEKMGYHTRIRRHREIDRAEFDALIALVDAWRDTETERGFSMALGRLGDPADGACLMVEALFPADRVQAGPEGEVAGLLSFVPWGDDGFSLDVMRRNPRADNGVTELMVSALMGASREIGIRRVSLNFAVFRSAFEEGARIGAGPVLRVWRRMLLVVSRWWQIESLFRSNVKYRPDWYPRFLCYAETRDIALVGAASGVAEGFIDLPFFLRPRIEAVQRPPVELAGIEAPATAPAAVEGKAEVEPADNRPEQTRLRMEVREQLLAAGIDPYPPSFRPTAGAGELRLGEHARVAGRVLGVRDHGGVIFVRLRDWTGDAQLMLTRSATGDVAMDEFRRVVDLGDHVGAEGTMILSARGELSLEASEWLLTAKSLRPPPDKHRGITDPETRVRQRYLDLAVNPTARRMLAARSAAVRAVRQTLDGEGYLEVETPILQTIHGGANARPFRTHINAYDLPLYLRIAPELFLKRLMVGGVDRVFEIGRNFRNEGADASHNPEFTMLEAYHAYGDYTTMRTLAQELIVRAAQAANGSLVVGGRDHSGCWHDVDLAEPWPVITVNAAVSAALGVEVTADTDRSTLAALADARGIPCDPRWGRGAVLLELYEHLVEDRTVRPTFYTDFPAEVSPLTRPHREDGRLAERWDLVAFGAELGTAYSELVDPVEQRVRLTAQSLQAAGGDPEAMELDEDFLVALEYAMPPSGGLGMGLDRLMMMLTNSTIRDTIAFPLVRPRSRG
ncbi:bifunctional lysylphosphatidylglycerol synthetase/lysine--tRNA ligase LysX [Microlunatus panaciterrae]|nr:bifunctional lysylphosphatidylglycerol synthetase/lysine--tRNA ligase LysX [Microlunatus panaciterrae]